MSMIQLFNIPNYNIDTAKFSNLLHDEIVAEFEKNFCNYVGAPYGCTFNSATSAIFLLLTWLRRNSPGPVVVEIPSIIPPVVPNAILNASCFLQFVDNTAWVGSDYNLYLSNQILIIDSAQKVERGQFLNNKHDNKVIIYSFYPTKPVGSCDGGMIVSNNEKLINDLRTMALNGMLYSENNWERKQTIIGHKMYMNSIQAYIANENLKRLDEKKIKLKSIREYYNGVFDRYYRLSMNNSDHLYQIRVDNASEFIRRAGEAGIMCGIHYKAAHKHALFKRSYGLPDHLPNSEERQGRIVSIPFHEALTPGEIETVEKFVKRYAGGTREI